MFTCIECCKEIFLEREDYSVFYLHSPDRELYFHIKCCFIFQSRYNQGDDEDYFHDEFIGNP